MASSSKSVLVVSETGRCSEDIALALQQRRHLAIRPRHVSGGISDMFSLAVIDLGPSITEATSFLSKLGALPMIIVDSDSGQAGSDTRSTRLPRPFSALDFNQAEAAAREANATACQQPDLASISASTIRETTDTLRKIFTQVHNSEGIQIAAVAALAAQMVVALNSTLTDQLALTSFLETIRRHHEPTFAHSMLVTANAVLFGLHLRFSRRDLETIALCGLVHDIGKGIVPLSILDKPAKLSPEEMELIRRHPLVGEELLRRSGNQLDPRVLRAVRGHHEMLDGSGYPDGLQAEAIDDVVRVITIADIFTALIEFRAYKQPMLVPDALDVLRAMANSGKLDVDFVRCFAEIATLSWQAVPPPPAASAHSAAAN